MGKKKITLYQYTCERCQHEWIPREMNQEPRVCPKCKSPYWNKPRKNAIQEQNKARKVGK